MAHNRSSNLCAQTANLMRQAFKYNESSDDSR